MPAKLRNLRPHERQHHLFTFDQAKFDAECDLYERVKAVDPSFIFTWWREPPRPTKTLRRHGTYRFTWHKWVGRRAEMGRFKELLARYRSQRGRIATAITLPARRAGRARAKAADRGAVGRRRDTEFVASHFADAQTIDDWDYDNDCSWPCSCAACVPYQWDCWATHTPAPLRASILSIVAEKDVSPSRERARAVWKAFFSSAAV